VGCTPDPDQRWFPDNYLGKPEEYGIYIRALVKAITGRWVALYKEWYDTLLIGDLFK